MEAMRLGHAHAQRYDALHEGLASAKKGKRDCLECSHEKTELIRAARTKLRLTRRAYVAVYGQSRAAAEAVLAQ